MADFNLAKVLTGASEGGFVCDPTDRGGMTVNGISRRFWPKWEGWARVNRIVASVGLNPNRIDVEIRKDKILLQMIDRHYKKNFWDVNQLDLVKYQSIANELYDTGVNQGTETAAEMLQESLNLCNRNQSDYRDIGVDGNIGPNGETLKTLNNHAEEIPVLNVLNMLQGERYVNIMRKNRTQEKYLRGWLKRVIFDSRW